jgi:hypothetical protein
MKNNSLNVAIIIGRAIMRVFAIICISVGLVVLVTPFGVKAAPLKAGGDLSVTGSFSFWQTMGSGTATGSVNCESLASDLAHCKFIADVEQTFWAYGLSAYANITAVTTGDPANFYYTAIGTAEGMSINGTYGDAIDAEWSVLGYWYPHNEAGSISVGTNGVRTYHADIDVYISTTGFYRPPETNCMDTFKDKITVADAMDIYPPVETPQGPNAIAPALPDEMIAILPHEVAGTEIYHLSTVGVWNDGTSEKHDFAYSYDGTSYTSLEQLDELLCKDETGYYFRTAETTFYIRVNDTPGAFADNTPSAAPWPSYTLAVAEQVAPLNCADKFTYSGTFVGGMISAQGTTSALLPMALVVGDYYVIETSGSPWNDGTTDRYDVKISDSHTPALATEFSVWPYTDCSELTGVGQHKRYYFQAPFEVLSLWVNDDNMADNSGGPMLYKIYHVTAVTTWPTACETRFKVNSMRFEQTYDSAVPLGNVIPPTNWDFWSTGQIGNVINSNGAFLLDQWYMMETTGLYTDTNGRKFAASEWSDDSRGTWVPLEEWAKADCVVPVDKMGHYKVYWHFPDGKAVQLPTGYGVRVAPPDGVYQGNVGSMKLKVYTVTNLQVTGVGTTPVEGACDGKYDTTDHIIDASVPPTASGGIYVPSLTVGSVYSMNTAGYWQDDGAGGELTSAQISDDGGTTWHAWNEYPAALCFESFIVGDRAQLRLYFKADPGRAYKVRADDDTNWSANTTGPGGDVFGIKLYSALIIIDPWNSCTESYTLSDIKTGEVLYSHLGGATPSDAKRLDIVPGELYSIEMTSGEWFDAGGPQPTLPNYDFQLSFDDGSTWYDWDSRDMPGFQCSATGPQYGRVYFLADNYNTYARIRVADLESPVDFTNNTGQLMYKVMAASTGGNPNIEAYVPPSAVVACYTFPTRPTDALDIGAWIEYSRGSIQRFFIWCPEHTAALEAIVTDAKKLEPFYTITRISNFGADIKAQTESYDWQGGAPAMPFSGEGGGTDMQSLIPNFADGPYNGAPLEWTEVPTAPLGGQRDGTSMSNVTSCSAHIVLTMGESPLVVGFCTVMNFLKLTGINVGINIAIVLASILLFGRYLFKKWLTPLIQIMTHSGAQA